MVDQEQPPGDFSSERSSASIECIVGVNGDARVKSGTADVQIDGTETQTLSFPDMVRVSIGFSLTPANSVPLILSNSRHLPAARQYITT